MYFSDTVLIFVYFVPADSRYYRDESFTQLFNFLVNITKSGKTVITVGDHNGRLGNLKFADRLYAENVDKIKTHTHTHTCMHACMCVRRGSRKKIEGGFIYRHIQ